MRMVVEYKTSILGWEIHAFDKDGNIYVKERFTHQFGIMCNNFYVIRDDKSAMIYEGTKPKRKNKGFVLAKVYLEPTEALVVTSEHC